MVFSRVNKWFEDYPQLEYAMQDLTNFAKKNILKKNDIVADSRFDKIIDENNTISTSDLSKLIKFSK